MNIPFLLPHRFKKMGWFLLCFGLLLGVGMRFFGLDSDYFGRFSFIGIYSEEFFGAENFFTVVENGFLDEFTALLIIIGGILVGFCKTKVEDEFIQQMRWSSLVWSVYLNYGILLLAVLFIFGSPFMDVLLYNMFTILLFFIIRFHLLLRKANRL